MRMDEIKPSPGSTHSRKRVGRGNSSGHGNFSGRGCKGQKSRSGPGIRRGFEGGQLPLMKRLPRLRGFHSPNKVEFSLVNVGQLDQFDAGTVITAESLCAAGLVKNVTLPLKILGEGELKKSLTVKAGRFSATAQKKIAEAGGKVEVI
jgi:large subunit ribosomal protein L15